MPDPAISQTAPIRVLIVEDDDLQRQVLASVLTSAGFEVDAISGGVAAVWQAREGRYGVVLVDYWLPEIDGRAIAKLVGDFMGHAARPVLIALTATPDRVNAVEAGEESAFYAILGKSSGLQPLLQVIRSGLEAAPNIVLRQQAASSLLLQDWLDYDAELCRLMARRNLSGPARILVVEDDECQRMLLVSVLEQRGYVVETSSNGLEAIGKIRAGSFDLALIDYSMPEMDGLAAGVMVRDLMQDSVRPRLIALTASPERLSSREGPGPSVFDEIVAKSSDLEGLMSSVDRQLSVTHAASPHG